MERFGGLCECGDHAWAGLTRGYVTIVSPEDEHLIRDFPWRVVMSGRAARHPYAARSLWLGSGAQENQRLHRVISGEDAPVVDHRSGNTLDNRRPNLRPTDFAGNAQNASKWRGQRTSRFKGVVRALGQDQWIAGITVRGRSITLGRFSKERDAALAYDRAAQTTYGEFARTNASLGLL